jgi:hypothetical protein
MNLTVPIQYKKASVLVDRSSLLSTSSNDSAEKMNYHKCLSVTAGEKYIKALVYELQIQFAKYIHLKPHANVC